MITLSPGWRPLLTSIRFTETAPSCTATRLAERPSGSILKSITLLFARPNTGLPTYTTFVIQRQVHSHLAVRRSRMHRRNLAADGFLPMRERNDRRLTCVHIPHLRRHNLARRRVVRRP